MPHSIKATVLVVGLACLGSGPMASCNSTAVDRNDRSKMEQAAVTVKNHKFNVAVARSREEMRVGLMNVKADELGQDEGMLFAFPAEQPLGFWMKNTVIPLDIAFIDAKGRIVKIHTMKALDLSSYPSVKPARYALEVHAGRLSVLGIVEGDVVQITPGSPESH